MRLRECAIIWADASAVWPFLADPVLQADWNPKVVSVGRTRSGPVRFGERFEMIYVMSGRERRSRVEVTACRPLQRIVFLHRMVGDADGRVVEEAYDVVSHDNGVKVIQTIDLSRAGIPWLVRAVMWFISRFGWDAGESNFERLKRVVERPAVTG
jgi:hypothetical protein